MGCLQKIARQRANIRKKYVVCVVVCHKQKIEQVQRSGDCKDKKGRYNLSF